MTGGREGANAAAKGKETMGLKPNEQNEEQTPGEGSNRAARLGLIILVQAHYWQGQSACSEATLRILTTANRGARRRPFGRRDGINRGRLDVRQASRFAGLSPSPSQASSSTQPRRGTSATQRPPPRSHRRRRPPQPRAGLLPIQNPMPQPRRRRRDNPSHPSARCGTAALAQPLRRVTRSHRRRRGHRLALLQPSPSSGLCQWAPAPCRQRKPINPSNGRPSNATTGAKARPSASTGIRPQESPWCPSPSPV